MDVDETTLKKIAQITGGQYYRADNAERFQQIYAEINKLEKTEASHQQIHRIQGIVSVVCQRAAWCCCCWKSRWGKPCSGNCREIYDLRFTIYDLKMQFGSTFALVAAGFPAGAGAVLLVGVTRRGNGCWRNSFRRGCCPR